MRITKKIFNDLAIFMILLGISVGITFPFFCLVLGVPKEIALTPVYFVSCILAGVILAIMNITLARKTVGYLILQMSHKMKHVETILTNKKNDNSGEICNPSNCLVKTLSEVLELNSEIQLFSEMLTSHLELDILSREALNQLIKNTGANGGAILIEKSGELAVKATVSIKDPTSLENNERVLATMKTPKRQLIKFPSDVIIDGIIVDFHPSELLIEPILYKSTLLGVLLLVSTIPFHEQAISKIKFFSQELSLAFRNAITHNQMTQLAAVDSLTGLYNRRFGAIRLQEEFSRSVRSNTPLSLLMFDIDHFKKVNDTYGHAIGDKVLASIAKIALTSIREGDILLRYGGEEFICVLPGANHSDASMVAERIRIMVMDSYVKSGDQEIKVTISIGAVTYPRDNIYNSEQLIKLADEAMYIAKDTGRNRLVSY